ncbi:MAG: tetratricopeptide repeat protein [Chitinophagales bacterium]|nr:tetratricopeptide repeat protein [Bacteroidota bacterium]MCB9043903.1 tetratricopeptide repeat protein [Chitinophagales bacterium]
MKNFSFLLVSLFLFYSFAANAQSTRLLLQKGTKNYEAKNYTKAESQYRDAIAEDNGKDLAISNFNLGDALYQQGKYDEAIKTWQQCLGEWSGEPQKLSDVWYNQGNALLQSGKIDEAIDAYKQSLRLNAQNNEARYNLTFAKNLKKQQQEQQQENQQDQQNQENQQEQNQQNQDQQQQNQENADKNEQNQQQNNQSEEKEEKQEEQQSQQQKEEEEQEEKQEAQNAHASEAEQQNTDQQSDTLNAMPQVMTLSREQVDKILEGVKNDERRVQEKLSDRKDGQQMPNSGKDW